MAVVVGEAANFIAYAFAPAIVVTPMGALSVVIRFEFAHALLCKIHYHRICPYNLT